MFLVDNKKKKYIFSTSSHISQNITFLSLGVLPDDVLDSDQQVFVLFRHLAGSRSIVYRFKLPLSTDRRPRPPPPPRPPTGGPPPGARAYVVELVLGLDLAVHGPLVLEHL